VVHASPPGGSSWKRFSFKLDYGVIKRGYYGDSARTVAVGQVSPEAARLLDETRQALERGIAAMVPGNRISDIGAAIEAHIKPFGYGIVRDYVGHGIGRSCTRIHRSPITVLRSGRAASRILACARAWVLAIEPMINLGTHEVDTLPDGWTVVTRDGKLSSHWEHTIAVTEDGPRS